MRVAVTGAAGFIGSHTCERLIARGHDVIGIDSFDGHLYPAEVKRRNASQLARLPATRFRLVQADITDAGAMRASISHDVDVVCHFAALAGVRPSIAEPARYMRTNVEGTCVVLEAMRAARVTRLVFASSSSVYGARPAADLAAVAAFREDDPCLTPASPYAATKRMGELLCSTYRDLFGIGVSALRFFTVYGPRQRPDMAIHKFARAIAAGTTISMFGDGESRRDYTFITDIVSGTVNAIERVRPGGFAVYNLGGTATVSLRELIATIEDVVGKVAVIDRQPEQLGDVPITFADVSRARAALDYEPFTRLRDGIVEFWEWSRAGADWSGIGRP